MLSLLGPRIRPRTDVESDARLGYRPVDVGRRSLDSLAEQGVIVW
jgi:hypothetical protein